MEIRAFAARSGTATVTEDRDPVTTCTPPGAQILAGGWREGLNNGGHTGRARLRWSYDQNWVCDISVGHRRYLWFSC